MPKSKVSRLQQMATSLFKTGPASLLRATTRRVESFRSASLVAERMERVGGGHPGLPREIWFYGGNALLQGGFATRVDPDFMPPTFSNTYAN